MTDTTNTTEKAKRQAVAKRLWIDPTGKEVPEAEASGFTYVHLDATKAFGDAGKFSFQFGNPGSLETMLAIFGGLTLCGNIVNTWNGLEPDNRPENPIDAVKERFADMEDGKWVERTGFGGPRYDAEKLAESIHQAKGANSEGAAAYLAKINHAESGKGYAKTALAVPAVNTIYQQLTGKAKDLGAL